MQIHIARDGQQLGIYSPDTLISATTDGVLEMTDHAWVDGESNWLLLPDFARKFSIALPEKSVSTPPPPPKGNATEVQKKPTNTPSQTEYCCPKCESLDTKRIKILYESGKTKSSSTAESNNHNTVHISSESTTELAEKYAPPEKPTGYNFFLTVIMSAFAGAVIWLIIIAPLATLTAFKIIPQLLNENVNQVIYTLASVIVFILLTINELKDKSEEIEYKEKKKAWKLLMEKGCLCSRCGHEFMV